uniref:Uncharacterized protein n=1 Tax=Anguilla anguilla TaxID=7936 RepID=A0A0E9XDU1_ANGAN
MLPRLSINYCLDIRINANRALYLTSIRDCINIFRSNNYNINTKRKYFLWMQKDYPRPK